MQTEEVQAIHAHDVLIFNTALSAAVPAIYRRIAQPYRTKINC